MAKQTRKTKKAGAPAKKAVKKATPRRRATTARQDEAASSSVLDGAMKSVIRSAFLRGS